MRITFHGAARTVTGSLHELQVAGKRVLLDCGLYQGRRAEADRINRNFAFPARDVDAVLLSHAHIDHSGNLPQLVKQGFRGPIYSSAATADLCNWMLRDSAYLQEKDAEFINKRKHRRKALLDTDENHAVEPLYTMLDAEATLPLFHPVEMHRPEEIAPGLRFETYEAGHILGSNSIHIVHAENGKRTSLVFSGDIGRPDLPIIRDPEAPPPADYLIVESTYGGRLHHPIDQVKGKLAEIVNRTAQAGGKLIVPSFAVGRTQQLVLLLHELMKEQKIPELQVFVDSPLAVNATEVFREHIDLYDAETRTFLMEGEDPFGFQRLRYVREAAESKAINDLRYPHIVISASGMCEAGRILHHLRNGVGDPRNTLLIVGFMAEHTLGRKLLEGEREVNIFGEPVTVRAHVAKLNEMSGHADQNELLTWMRPMVGSLKKVFLVHGEPAQMEALKTRIEGEHGLEVVIPQRGDSYLLP
ncbi:MAG: MBL fold metallo-hydrolase [Bryobacterales bacterium]|jgi:metallo-beta-lactamase family protein|nr:MBL fold metallo-hydrolase [Bryobacterales bacterium]